MEGIIEEEKLRNFRYGDIKKCLKEMEGSKERKGKRRNSGRVKMIEMLDGRRWGILIDMDKRGKRKNRKWKNEEIEVEENLRVGEVGIRKMCDDIVDVGIEVEIGNRWEEGKKKECRKDIDKMKEKSRRKVKVNSDSGMRRVEGERIMKDNEMEWRMWLGIDILGKRKKMIGREGRLKRYRDRKEEKCKRKGWRREDEGMKEWKIGDKRGKVLMDLILRKVKIIKVFKKKERDERSSEEVNEKDMEKSFMIGKIIGKRINMIGIEIGIGRSRILRGMKNGKKWERILLRWKIDGSVNEKEESKKNEEKENWKSDKEIVKGVGKERMIKIIEERKGEVDKIMEKGMVEMIKNERKNNRRNSKRRDKGYNERERKSEGELEEKRKSKEEGK